VQLFPLPEPTSRELLSTHLLLPQTCFPTFQAPGHSSSWPASDLAGTDVTGDVIQAVRFEFVRARAGRSPGNRFRQPLTKTLLSWGVLVRCVGILVINF